MNRSDFDDFLNGLDEKYDLMGTKIRTRGAVVNNFEYFTANGKSEEFLQDQVGNRLDMSMLFVDLVGSTHLSRILPEQKLTALITSFGHEMSDLIDMFGGYTLKFIGDAAIGYFVGDDSASRAVQCATGMLYKTEYALKEMYSDIKHDEEDRIVDKLSDGTITDKDVKLFDDMINFLDFAVRVGLDYGTNTVVRYGRASQEYSTVDLIGYPLNLTSKIQAHAGQNEVLAGENLYSTLPLDMQTKFMVKLSDTWGYCHPGTDKRYNLYALSFSANRLS